MSNLEFNQLKLVFYCVFKQKNKIINKNAMQN